MIENLILGSARWGSSISKETAFGLLDKFVESGGSYIDGAKNYPINSVTNDFGLANKYLIQWISHNPKTNLNVFIKLGSVNNLGGPESDLSAKTINHSFEILQQSFGTNLGGIGVHWDNRGFDEIDQIHETLQQFDRFHHKGFRIGMSGVKEIGSYFQLAPNLNDEWEIQVKETVDDKSVREKYLRFFPKASYLVYGINGGKFPSKGSIRASIENKTQSKEQESKADCYFLRIKRILESHGVSKVIIGPRTLEQLDSILIRTSDDFE